MALKSALQKVRDKKKLWDLEQDYLRKLGIIASRPSGATLRLFRQLIREAEERGVSGFGGSANVAKIKLDFQDNHTKACGFIDEGREQGPPIPGDENFHNLIVDPLLQGGSGDKKDKAIVLALVRGVLYACQRGTGRVQWARRVGIDTTSLPVRVAKTDLNPELILVLSADTATLTAVDRDNNTVWEYRLGKPCFGRPVIVEGRAYLATEDGQVHVIELTKGRLLGRFTLGEGEKLTGFGTHQEGTNLVYFPAEEGCVYVLDVKENRCVTILYTGHSSRSVRGEPLVLAPEPPAPGYLILNQSVGLDETQLRVYTLPLTSGNAEPVSLDRQPRVHGSIWFQPYHDEEKIVLASDAGFLGLFGIKQLRNHDQALFPAYPAGAEGFSLETFLPAPRTKKRGRDAQVVHVQGDDYWVLAHGQMQRLQLAWRGSAGPVLAPTWPAPVRLGSPLHESQVDEDPFTGKATLITVTQALDQPTCLVTAIDDETGKILWQRQLGLVCQGEPVLLKSPENELPLLLAMDQGGALLSFDPMGYKVKQLGEWQGGGADDKRLIRPVAPAMEENPRFAPVLLRDESGKAAWQAACPGNGLTLRLRRVVWSATDRLLKLRGEVKVELPDVLAGPPVRMGDMLLLPLDNGVLARLQLPDDKVVLAEAKLVVDEGGPDWRCRRQGSETPGYLLPLGGNRLLAWNGRDGVQVWNWPAAKGLFWEALPKRPPPKRGSAKSRPCP